MRYDIELSTYSIENKNTIGEYHGYQEWYWMDNTLFFRGNGKNGQSIGYCENHSDKTIRYHI
jgi:hypothetical protein